MLKKQLNQLGPQASRAIVATALVSSIVGQAAFAQNSAQETLKQMRESIESGEAQEAAKESALAGKNWVNTRVPAPGEYTENYLFVASALAVTNTVAFSTAAAALRYYNKTRTLSGKFIDPKLGKAISMKRPWTVAILQALGVNVVRVVLIGASLVAIADIGNSAVAIVVDGETVAPFAVWRAVGGYAVEVTWNSLTAAQSVEIAKQAVSQVPAATAQAASAPITVVSFSEAASAPAAVASAASAPAQSASQPGGAASAAEQGPTPETDGNDPVRNTPAVR